MVVEWREELTKRLSPGVDKHRINLPKGWQAVVMKIVDGLDRLKIPWKLERAEIKHGALYFIPYVEIDHRDQKFDALTRIIHKGDMEAAKTCEDCGDQGEPRSVKYRAHILCDGDYLTRIKELKESRGGTSI